MDRLDLYDQSINLIEQYTKCVLKNNPGDGNNTTLALLSNQVKSYCEAKEKFKMKEDVFNNTVQLITEEENSETVLKKYEENLKKNLKKIKSVDNNERYIKYLELLQNDGDICAVSENLNTIDPITKQRIVNPVKNKKCGHTYEKNSILELIKTRPHTRCPIVGCSAKQYVTKQDLVPDLEFQRYLAIQVDESECEVSSISIND